MSLFRLEMGILAHPNDYPQTDNYARTAVLARANRCIS